MVRCKFKCTQKTETGPGEYQIFFEAVTSGSKENEVFFKYTPGGSFKLFTVNATVASQFEVDKEYYIDISPDTVTSHVPTVEEVEECEQQEGEEEGED